MSPSQLSVQEIIKLGHVQEKVRRRQSSFLPTIFSVLDIRSFVLEDGIVLTAKEYCKIESAVYAQKTHDRLCKKHV